MPTLVAMALTSFLTTGTSHAANAEAQALIHGVGCPDALVKPPPMDDPRQALVQKAVRTAYPELFGPSAPAGYLGVTLLMNSNWTLYRSYKDDPQPNPHYANDLKAFDMMGVEYEHRGGRVQLAMKGGVNGATGISVRAYVLKPPADARRDFALVRASVNARYRGLYKARSAESVTALTVMMSESGGIARAKATTVNAIDADVPPTPEKFVELGIPRARIGPISKVMLYEGEYDGRLKSERLLVIYAWPRRAGEPAPKPWHAEQSGPFAPDDDPAVDRAIAEKYFPDLYTYTKPESEADADFWVVLDREGRVLATGRRYLASRVDQTRYLESLYPGIRTDGFEPVGFYGEHGRLAVVNFMWLAPDSPVTDLSKVDLSKRSDLVFYADIHGAGGVSTTNLQVLKFGSPAIAVDDGNNLDLQVTASNGDPESVILRARIQHVTPMGTFQWGTPRALDTAWSEETRPIRVRYGESGEMQITDQDHRVWNVVLHPNRMEGNVSLSSRCARR
jgi:hypothetical protein